MTTTTTPVTKMLFLEALDVFRAAYAEDRGFLAAELVIGFLLDNGVDMSEAHTVLAGIHCVEDYNLTVS